jgi:hypothetical protein
MRFALAYPLPAPHPPTLHPSSLILALLPLTLVALGARTARAETRPAEPGAEAAAMSQSAQASTQYGEHAVGVVDRRPAFRDTFFSGPTWEAFTLKDHHVIEQESFLRLAGRDDLARRQHRRTVLKTSLSVGGWSLLASGSVYALWNLTCCQAGALASSPASRAETGATVGLVMAAVGLLTLSANSVISGEAIDASEATAVGAAYNRALGDHLALPAAFELSRRDPR